jgi:hypothetical protein
MKKEKDYFIQIQGNSNTFKAYNLDKATVGEVYGLQVVEMYKPKDKQYKKGMRLNFVKLFNNIIK